MAKPKIKVTGKQVNDLQAGKDIVVAYLGTQYLVSPGLAYYARAQFLAGQTITLLAPTWVNNAVGPMEEIEVYL